jgi:hydrogenase nickel incorporation protein HypA/HybF
VHEYSIVHALLDRVEREARAHGADAVVRIQLAIGELAGVEAPLLASAFELARAGTRAAGAELELRAVAPRWVCRSCEMEIPAGGALRCVSCDAPARLAAGDELILERLEMEVA